MDIFLLFIHYIISNNNFHMFHVHFYKLLQVYYLMQHKQNIKDHVLIFFQKDSHTLLSLLNLLIMVLELLYNNSFQLFLLFLIINKFNKYIFSLNYIFHNNQVIVNILRVFLNLLIIYNLFDSILCFTIIFLMFIFLIDIIINIFNKHYDYNLILYDIQQPEILNYDGSY